MYICYNLATGKGMNGHRSETDVELSVYVYFCFTSFTDAVGIVICSYTCALVVTIRGIVTEQTCLTITSCPFSLERMTQYIHGLGLGYFQNKQGRVLLYKDFEYLVYA